jgi:hypothetical protein
MRRYGCTLLFAFSTVLFAQSASTKPRPPIVRDPAAIQAVERAISAFGGSQALSGARTWIADGTTTVNGTATPLHWEATREEFYVENGSPGSQVILTSGHGHPAVQRASGVTAIPYHVHRSWIRPFAIGALLAQELADSNYSFEVIPRKEDPSVIVVRTIDHQSVIDSMVTPQLWYFDKSTGLPDEILYEQHDLKNPGAFGWVTMTPGDYQSEEGVLTPFSVGYATGGHITERMQFTSVEVNENIPDSQFAALQGANQ